MMMMMMMTSRAYPLAYPLVLVVMGTSDVCRVCIQCELLELMLLYYRSSDFKINDLLNILTHFRVRRCFVQ